MRSGKIKLSFLGIAKLCIVEVREADHRRATDAACDHALTYLADDIVRIDSAKTPPLPLENTLTSEFKKAAQLLWPACLPAHRLEARAGRPYHRKVELYVFSGIPCAQPKRERIAP